ncbi:MAG: CBS domain-containing protein [Nitrospirae bacterium]|nr:MAG: CBS domain-containing protein [Nitrospirota bacterium]
MQSEPEGGGLCRGLARLLAISDEDVVAAMRGVEGYLDITPGDFRELYELAYAHAVSRITHRLRLREVMVRHVVTVEPATPVAEVARVMAEAAVSGVVVVDPERRPVGVVSERDFLVRLAGGKAASFMAVVAGCLADAGCAVGPLKEERAEEIMSAPAVTAGEEEPLCAATDLLYERDINRLPVVDGEGRLAGIVTRHDLVRALFGGGAE